MRDTLLLAAKPSLLQPDRSYGSLEALPELDAYCRRAIEEAILRLQRQYTEWVGWMELSKPQTAYGLLIEASARLDRLVQRTKTSKRHNDGRRR